MFQGVSIQQFNKFFQNEDDCKQYLFDLKWRDGYQCRKCGCKKRAHINIVGTTQKVCKV